MARILSALVLFGLSFGYVEAAVVVYLRGLYEPVHRQLYPGRDPGDLFPVLRLDQLEAVDPALMRLLLVELVREAATMVMLAAVALAVARNFRQWFAAFLIAFGVWDIAFYLGLRVLLGWPESLLTWDLLFLVPVPWVGPVLAPVLVAVSMIGAGVLVLRREFAGRPLRLSATHWAAVLAGGLLVVLAFCWDFRNTLAGGEPNSFNWPLFALGEVVGLFAVLHAAWASRLTPDEALARRPT